MALEVTKPDPNRVGTWRLEALDGDSLLHSFTFSATGAELEKFLGMLNRFFVWPRAVSLTINEVQAGNGCQE